VLGMDRIRMLPRKPDGPTSEFLWL
jgi:hypothetical protein